MSSRGACLAGAMVTEKNVADGAAINNGMLAG